MELLDLPSELLARILGYLLVHPEPIKPAPFIPERKWTKLEKEAKQLRQPGWRPLKPIRYFSIVLVCRQLCDIAREVLWSGNNLQFGKFGSTHMFQEIMKSEVVDRVRSVEYGKKYCMLRLSELRGVDMEPESARLCHTMFPYPLEALSRFAGLRNLTLVVGDLRSDIPGWPTRHTKAGMVLHAPSRNHHMVGEPKYFCAVFARDQLIRDIPQGLLDGLAKLTLQSYVVKDHAESRQNPAPEDCVCRSIDSLEYAKALRAGALHEKWWNGYLHKGSSAEWRRFWEALAANYWDDFDDVKECNAWSQKKKSEVQWCTWAKGWCSSPGHYRRPERNDYLLTM